MAHSKSAPFISASFLKLKGASFGVRNKHLILSYVRPVRGLDLEELEWIVASIAVIADEYDDFLIEKFNL